MTKPLNLLSVAQKGSKKCSSHIIKHDALKQVVLANLKDDNSLNMQSLVDLTIQRAGIKKNNAFKELEKIKHEISKLDKEIVQLTRKWSSGEIDKEILMLVAERLKTNGKQ